MGEEMDQGARKTLPVFGDRGHSRSLLTFTTLNVTKADVQFFPPSPVTRCLHSLPAFPSRAFLVSFVESLVCCNSIASSLLVFFFSEAGNPQLKFIFQG